MPEQGVADSHAGDMGDHQRRNAQAEHELQRLDGCPAKFAPFVERPDPEPGMEHDSRVEGDRHRRELPERGVVIDAGGKRIQRDVAERVVEEMADQIGIQHQPAGQANLPHADALEFFPDLVG